MESSPEATVRRAELERAAPMRPRGLWMRTTWNGKDVVFLCGTLGAEFDAWQRALAATSAADAYLAQLIGLDAVEREMDALEAEARAEVEREQRGSGVPAALQLKVSPRRSPGYGDLPLDLSREIVRRLDATKRIGVSVTDSDLLVPAKSVTAICEITTQSP